MIGEILLSLLTAADRAWLHLAIVKDSLVCDAGKALLPRGPAVKLGDPESWPAMAPADQSYVLGGAATPASAIRS